VRNVESHFTRAIIVFVSKNFSSGDPEMKKMLPAVALIALTMFACPLPSGGPGPGPGPDNTAPSLSSLSVSGMTLDPAFSPGVFSYQTSIAVAATSAVVIPQLKNSSDTLTYTLGTGYAAWPSNNTIALAAGNQMLTINLTSASNPLLNASYSIHFNRIGASSNVLYVATWGNDSTGNGSVSAPYASPTKAVTASSSLAKPVEIRVAAGTYTVSSSLQPGDDVSLKGGYNSDFSARQFATKADRENPTYRTEIDYPGTTWSPPYIVADGAIFYNKSIGASTVIEGLVICGGNGTKSYSMGLVLQNGACPAIKNCTLTGNSSITAINTSRAVYVNGTTTSPQFTDCLIYCGPATQAYGLSAENGASVSLTTCEIHDWITGPTSGNPFVYGVSLSSSSAVVTKCTIIAGTDGKAWYTYGISAYNCPSVSVNGGRVDGGAAGSTSTGLTLSNVANVAVAGCTLAGGTGLSLSGSGGTISGNTITATYKGATAVSMGAGTASISLDNNTIQATTTDSSACGISIQGLATGTISHNTITVSSNFTAVADYGGTGISTQACAISFTDNTINVSAAGAAEGILCYDISMYDQDSAVFQGNTVTATGGSFAVGFALQGPREKPQISGNNISASSTYTAPTLVDAGKVWGMRVQQQAAPIATGNTITLATGAQRTAYGLDCNGGMGTFSGNTINPGPAVDATYGVYGGYVGNYGDATPYLRIENNTILGGTAAQTCGMLVTNSGCDNTAVVRNTIRGGSATARSTGLLMVRGALVADNLIIGGSGADTRGVSVESSSSPAKLWLLNNTVDAGSGTTTAYAIWTDDADPGAAFRNNILTASSAGKVFGVYVGTTWDNPQLHFNDFDASRIGTLVQDYVGNPLTTPAAVNALQSKYGSCAGGNIADSPSLDAATYKPTASSPAGVVSGAQVLSASSAPVIPAAYPVDAGGNPVDKDGTVRGASWTMGAFEY
jgi:hypothetical protein